MLDEKMIKREVAAIMRTRPHFVVIDTIFDYGCNEFKVAYTVKGCKYTCFVRDNHVLSLMVRV